MTWFLTANIFFSKCSRPLLLNALRLFVILNSRDSKFNKRMTRKKKGICIKYEEDKKEYDYSSNGDPYCWRY